MCGILFKLGPSQAALSAAVPALLDEVAKRGPDSTQTHRISIARSETSPAFFLEISSSVLSLRGQEVVKQPLIDARYVFCWNGQVFRGLDVDIAENDTDQIWKAILAGRHIGDILDEVEGPYAFLLYDKASLTLTYGRDRLGRRSLLKNTGDDGVFVISSVSPARSGSTGQSVSTHQAYQEVDCSSFWQTTIRDIRFDLNGKVDLSSALFPVKRSTIHSIDIPRLSDMLPPSDSAEGGPLEPTDELIEQFIHNLRESVKLRVENIPPSKNPSSSRLAVLFSGGIDCAFITYLVSTLLPPDEPIDLLNVAFENPRAIAAANALRDLNAQRAGNPKRKLANMCNAPTSLAIPIPEMYDVPDRLTGRESLAVLRQVHPERDWRFVEIDITYAESQASRERVLQLMSPSDTEMDLSLALPLYFAARRSGIVRNDQGQSTPYQSQAKVLLSGLGADELLGGYARHRKEFNMKGWIGAIDEMQMDLDRIPTRNLGRDDRIISSHGVEARFPYLDMPFIRYIAELPVWVKCDLRLGEGYGDKSLLRHATRSVGMGPISTFKKRAMQFGTRAARMQAEDVGKKNRGLGGKKIEM